MKQGRKPENMPSPIKSEIAKLQSEIDTRKQALRALLETEHRAAQALVAETAEALATLGDAGPAAPVVKDTGRPGSRPAVRAALRKFGAMTAGECSVVAKITRGAASGALFRLVQDGEVTRTLTPGRKRDAVYELVSTGKV